MRKMQSVGAATDPRTRGRTKQHAPLGAPGDESAGFIAEPLTPAALKVLHSRPRPDAEFLRPGDFRPVFGLSRSMVYLLEQQGVIRTVTLRRPGTARGVKLVDVASVRAYLNKHVAKEPQTD